MLFNQVECGSFTKGVFENVLAVVFQSVFRSEMYQNNVFFHFLKLIFDISTSKRSKNTKK